MTGSRIAGHTSCCAAATLVCLTLLMPSGALAQVPNKWLRSAASSPDYEMGGNPTVKHGAEGGGYIRSVGQTPNSYGNLRTEMPPGAYLGKRVRLTGYVRTESVQDRAALWIRVEGPGGVWLGLDNMDDRPIKGTTDWTKHNLVVDVPAASANIVVGMRLVGTGKVWVDGVTLEAVGPDVPVTDRPGRWVAGGSVPGDYDVGGDPTVKHGTPGGGYLRSKVQTTKETGAFATWVVPSPYLGRRVRLSAYVRTDKVRKSAGLYLGAGGANNAMLSYANTEDRPIKGTTDWKRYDLVIDVPAASVNVSYGAYVDGGGQAWIDGVVLEVMGPDLALTGQSWGPTGSNPDDYEMGGDPSVAHGADGGGYIRSKVEAPKSFGSWASMSAVGAYLGKRVRLSGYVRTEGAEGWVGLWMRVDGANGSLTFDNMSTRPIKGTTDWKKYDVVLDVPANAVGIMYGLMVSGKGKAWFDGVTLELVGTDVPVTQVANPYTEYNAGNFADATKLFPERIAKTPTSYTLRLFYFLSLHRSGQISEARSYIDAFAADLKVPQWGDSVVLFYAGRGSEQDVLKAATDPKPTTDNWRKCQAYFYLGMAYLLGVGNVPPGAPSNVARATQYLEKSVATGATTSNEFTAAQTELERIKK